MSNFRIWTLACLFAAGLSPARASDGHYVERVAVDEAPCLSPEQIERIEARIRARRPLRLNDNHVVPPKLYRFFPMAGIWERDLIPGNFVDLDSTSAIRTYNCAAHSYNGHRGHDVGPMMRSFEKMDGDVPIFAALDGEVIDAHDGEYDRNTSCTGDPNYVILDHGDGHHTWYLHMKKDTVAVSVGQQVRAGQQLGLMGSSGCSTRPHLHFETRWNGATFEPFRGLCNLQDSGWEIQPPLRSDTFVTEVYNANGATPEGMFVSGLRNVRAYIAVRNLPANSTYRYQVIRPDLTAAYDSGTLNFGHAVTYPLSYWFFGVNVNLNTSGTWYTFIHLNGNLEVTAPFTVVSTAAQAVNRPPVLEKVEFEPAAPRADDVVFCQVTDPWLFQDPDYDLVRYRYVWRINGTVVRDVTHAGLADALRRSLGNAGDTLICTVTATDGNLNSALSRAVSVTLGAPMGDVTGSGTVTSVDVVRALRIAGGLHEGTAAEVDRGDMNNGGLLNIVDVVRIARKIQGRE